MKSEDEMKAIALGALGESRESEKIFSDMRRIYGKYGERPPIEYADLGERFPGQVDDAD